jgi:bifunctional DNase/RNase
LGEVSGRRRLPIIIGSFEAQAIAIEIEKMTPSRPLTHDLFKSLGQAFNITVQEIIIYNLVDGIFYSKLVCFDGKKTVEIDARTSDAIAVSVRFDCPIYTYEFILSTAGIVIEGNDFVYLENINETNRRENTLYTWQVRSPPLSDDELKTRLQQALSEEAYEKAAKIRDELNKRKAS